MSARRWLPWLVLAALVAGALAVATYDDEGPSTDADRARAIAATVRCPTCRGQSVLESDAPTAGAIRDEITRRIEAGQSDAEIRAYLVSVHGRQILLNPPRSGLAAMVWVLPVAVLLAGIGGLALALHRWQTATPARPSTTDRAVVEAARRSHEGQP